MVGQFLAYMALKGTAIHLNSYLSSIQSQVSFRTSLIGDASAESEALVEFYHFLKAPAVIMKFALI